MKVKLLKKVRKRFQIVHYPNGLCGFESKDIFKLSDNQNSYFSIWAQCHKDGDPLFCEDTFPTKSECVNFLLGEIIKKLREEGHRQRRFIKKYEMKLIWYNKK
jgi:hypothetical protein